MSTNQCSLTRFRTTLRNFGGQILSPPNMSLENRLQELREPGLMGWTKTTALLQKTLVNFEQ